MRFRDTNLEVIITNTIFKCARINEIIYGRNIE